MEILLKEYGIRVDLKEGMSFNEFKEICLTNKVLQSTPIDFVDKYLKRYFNGNKSIKYESDSQVNKLKKPKDDDNRASKEPKKNKSN